MILGTLLLLGGFGVLLFANKLERDSLEPKSLASTNGLIGETMATTESMMLKIVGFIVIMIGLFYIFDAAVHGHVYKF